MNTITVYQKKSIIKKENNIQQLKLKAAFWDEFMDFIEDKYLGYFMELTEKEKNISLIKAKKHLIK